MYNVLSNCAKKITVSILEDLFAFHETFDRQRVFTRCSPWKVKHAMVESRESIDHQKIKSSVAIDSYISALVVYQEWWLNSYFSR